jgi:hypothetical protein
MLAACCAFCAVSRAAGAPSIEAGFNGFVKADRWFPVRVTGAHSPASYEVFASSEGWCGGAPTPFFHAAGTLSSGSATFLCKLPDSSRMPFVDFASSTPAGALQKARASLKPLSKNDLLVLVVSTEPNAFNFLGSIQLEDRGVVCVVPVPAAEFPADWRELDCADIVLLDVPISSLREESIEALHDWTVAGGTVVLSAGTPASGAAAQRSWLLPETGPGISTTDAAELLKPLVGEYGRHLISVPAVSLRVRPIERLLGLEESTILAARDVGRGRTIALGFDWQQMEMRDRMFIDGARHAAWTRIISLVRPVEHAHPNNDLVTPAEARAGFLIRYIAVFLAVYVILLGPVNWLVLRKMKKLEYSIVTIPAGALVFTIVAFILGLALRSDHTIVNESEVVWVQDSDRGLLLGTAGILSPDRVPYTLSAPDSNSLLSPEGRDSWMPENTRLRDLPVYDTSGGMSVSNVKIGMWSIRFFSTRGVVPLNGFLAGELALGGKGLSGVLTNGTSFAIRDAVLMHRWNRTVVGDIEPGASREVVLPLAPASRQVFTRCRNCGRCHGTDISLSERYCKDHPLPSGMREMATALDLNTASPLPILAGWVDTPGPSIGTGRLNPATSRKRLLVFVIPVKLAGVDSCVPEGFLSATVTRQGGERHASFVQDIRNDMFADRGKPESSDPFGMLRSQCQIEMVDRFGDDITPVTGEFRLPFRSPWIETARLEIHWDTGETGEDAEIPSSTVLTVFDWKNQAWADIATATTGECSVAVSEPARFVREPDCVVAYRTLVATNRLKSAGNGNFLEIEWAGKASEQ